MARTEGWAAGLRLVTLALQHNTTAAAAEQFLTTFTGGHRHVVEHVHHLGQQRGRRDSETRVLHVVRVGGVAIAELARAALRRVFL